jgi:hypoxanthine phosphoribosyltransferase
VPVDVRGARARAELLVDADAVLRAVDQLAVRLALRLQDANPWLLTVMHGALPFAGWLLPKLAFPLQVGYLHVSRYRDATSGGDLHWHAMPDYPLQGRTVLLLDDVLDRGETLAALASWARDAGSAEVLTAVLVDKAGTGPRPIEADFVALHCADRFLFGCGMDYRGYWRNLPGIYALPGDGGSSG